MSWRHARTRPVSRMPRRRRRMFSKARSGQVSLSAPDFRRRRRGWPPTWPPSKPGAATPPDGVKVRARNTNPSKEDLMQNINHVCVSWNWLQVAHTCWCELFSLTARLDRCSR
jgi:hypothetical protein